MKPATSTPRSLRYQIIRSCLRVASVLIFLFVTGCFMVAQPSTRSNVPSSKNANEAKLRQHVDALSKNFHPRNSDNPENLNRCADYISTHLKEAGATVEMQEFIVDKIIYKNVIGRFGVGKPKKIIVGAHYDSCADTPGADDNASGVAGLLELARLIGKDQPDVEIELVAYTLEEPPFFGGPQMGSAFHARSVAAEKDRIIGVIVLEMIGYFSDEPGSQSYPLPIMKGYYPSRGNYITVVSRWDQSDWIADLKAGMKGTTDLPVYSFRGPASLPGVDFSDHRNYWPHNIPAAMVTNTAFYRNKNYHTPNDTPESLDYPRMGKVVVGVYEAIKVLDK
jgi:Zn-dependent M28 family amino/carboxypeptidase